MTQMTLKRARKAGQDGKGFVLSGFPTPDNLQDWFERWFPTEEAAGRYAGKKGWAVERGE